MEGTYIEKLKHSLNNLEGSFSHFSLEQDNIELDAYYIQLNSTSNDFFKYLNYSLLSGEYINIENLKEQLEDLNPQVLVDYTAIVPEELQESVLEFVGAIRLAIRLYISFIDNVVIDYTADRIDLLHYFDLQIRKEFQKSNLEEYRAQIELFNNNIIVSHKDIFPTADIEYFKDLIEIQVDLERESVNEDIERVLLLKINFLLHKWQIRIQKSNTNPYSRLYMIDGTIDAIKEYSRENIKLNEWESYLLTHYEKTSLWKTTIENKVRPLFNKPISDLTLIESHLFIKYYKDVNKNIEKLKSIANHLYSLPVDNFCNYDKYVYSIISNYAWNNYFSVFVEETSSIDQVLKEYNSVRELLKGESINYFLQFKALSKFNELFMENLYGDTDYSRLKELKTYLSSFQNILLEYRKNMEWSENDHHFIFLLPFENSLIEIQNINELEKIFVASSFLLPPDSSIIKEQYEDIKHKINEFKIQLSAIEIIQKDLLEIRRLNSEFDKREFKSIEILGLFTALITFVFSSITGFKFIEDSKQAILFTIALSSSMGLFALFILFTTRKFEQITTKWHWIIIAIILIALCCSFGYTRYFQ